MVSDPPLQEDEDGDGEDKEGGNDNDAQGAGTNIAVGNDRAELEVVDTQQVVMATPRLGPAGEVNAAAALRLTKTRKPGARRTSKATVIELVTGQLVPPARTITTSKLMTPSMTRQRLSHTSGQGFSSWVGLDVGY